MNEEQQTFITTNLKNYMHFVIVTFLREDVLAVLNKIPPNKRIMIGIDCYEPGLEGGITVINGDFEFMGCTTTEYIVSGEIQSIANPSKLILRKLL